MMTWEETIYHIRTLPEYKYLVEKAYFESDLSLNVERFKQSTEYAETLRLLKTFKIPGQKLLDIGCGNGISSIAFALEGYEVTSVEPDPSPTIGAGAIKTLVKGYNLDNVSVHEAFAEDIQFESETFDVVYIRQAMHHAYDLNKFILECGRVLKRGGLLITIRDHVIFNKKDKADFLKYHPLQKFYGGENAYTSVQYKEAMTNAGMDVKLELKHYESVINFFPLKQEEVDNLDYKQFQERKKHLSQRIGKLANVGLIAWFFHWYQNLKHGSAKDEVNVPGRMYSYFAVKL